MRYSIFIFATAMCIGISALAAEPATAPATTQPTTAPSTSIAWSDATKYVNQTVTITGPVVSTHVSSDKRNLTLNVGKDYPSPDRFTIFMPNDPNAGSPDDMYKGKTVAVTGKIILYKKTAEIKATSKDVTVQK